MSELKKITSNELYLLDQFAKEAITAIYSNTDTMDAADLLSDCYENFDFTDAISRIAYLQAEAMIKARRRLLKVVQVVEEVEVEENENN